MRRRPRAHRRSSLELTYRTCENRFFCEHFRAALINRRPTRARGIGCVWPCQLLQIERGSTGTGGFCRKRSLATSLLCRLPPRLVGRSNDRQSPKTLLDLVETEACCLLRSCGFLSQEVHPALVEETCRSSSLSTGQSVRDRLRSFEVSRFPFSASEKGICEGLKVCFI